MVGHCCSFHHAPGGGRELHNHFSTGATAAGAGPAGGDRSQTLRGRRPLRPHGGTTRRTRVPLAALGGYSRPAGSFGRAHCGNLGLARGLCKRGYALGLSVARCARQLCGELVLHDPARRRTRPSPSTWASYPDFRRHRSDFARICGPDPYAARPADAGILAASVQRHGGQSQFSQFCNPTDCNGFLGAAY